MKLRALSLLALGVVACTPTPSESISSTDQALTDEQCDYFAVAGKTTICHWTGTQFMTLRVAKSACVKAHGTHPTDYVAVDGDCGPNACLPESAPCDETLRCCSGFACERSTQSCVQQSKLPTVALTLNPIDDKVVRGSGFATYAVTDPTFTNVALECKVNGVVSSTCSWSGLPDGASVEIEVTATDRDTGLIGPTAKRTATVDEAPPVLAFVGLQDQSVVGPKTNPTFGITSSETVATLSCQITSGTGIVEGCGPGDAGGQLIWTGSRSELFCVTVTATDAVGNVAEPRVLCVNIDADGPNVLNVRSPSWAVCPSARTCDVIQFDGLDAPNFSSQPLHFFCTLDGAPVACTQTSAQAGEFAWSSLSPGAHTFVVSALDPFNNIGPNCADPDGTTANGVPQLCSPANMVQAESYGIKVPLTVVSDADCLSSVPECAVP